MGSSQSTKRLREQFISCGSSDYARLSSSPAREPLLDHDSVNTCDCFEQYETKLKDMLRKNVDNEHKVAELLRNIQYLENQQLSHKTAMDKRVMENAATVKKVKKLESKIEFYHHVENRLVSKNAALDRSIQENTELRKRISVFQKRIDLLTPLIPEVDIHQGRKVTNLTRVTKPEQQIQRLESCLFSKNVEPSNKEDTTIMKKVVELEQKIKQLELMLGFPMKETESDEDVAEPLHVYVQQIMAVMILLIFIVGVSIGIHL